MRPRKEEKGKNIRYKFLLYDHIVIVEHKLENIITDTKDRLLRQG